MEWRWKAARGRKGSGGAWLRGCAQGPRRPLLVRPSRRTRTPTGTTTRPLAKSGMAYAHSMWFFLAYINPEYRTELRGRTGESCHKPALTIDALPNDVLLEIFVFCVSCPGDDPGFRMQEWQSLVQVCKRWKETVFASPRYLDLFLYFSNGDSTTETLDRWPELPLQLSYSVFDDRDDNLYNALG